MTYAHSSFMDPGRLKIQNRSFFSGLNTVLEILMLLMIVWAVIVAGLIVGDTYPLIFTDPSEVIPYLAIPAILGVAATLIYQFTTIRKMTCLYMILGGLAIVTGYYTVRIVAGYHNPPLW